MSEREECTRTRSYPPTAGSMTSNTCVSPAGRIRLISYVEYVNAFGGVKILAGLLFLMLSAQACSIGSTVWLSLWSQRSADDDSNFMLYFGGYALLSFLSVLVTAM